MDITHFLEFLQERHWVIEEENSPLPINDPKFLRRFGEVPEVYETIFNLKSCIASDYKSWFLTSKDYNRVSEDPFAWDFIEELTLENCPLPEDIKFYTLALAFWEETLPILLCVQGGYEYLAIKTSGQNKGAIVYGYGLEPEGESIISPSFEDFIHEVMTGKITNIHVMRMLGITDF
jgi:hypothetical protein